LALALAPVVLKRALAQIAELDLGAGVVSAQLVASGLFVCKRTGASGFVCRHRAPATHFRRMNISQEKPAATRQAA
jgi:hypothetical protein